MKTIKYLTIIFSFMAPFSYAQTIHWGSLRMEDKHILNLNAGWDYGMNYGIGYGYKLNSRIPLILGTEISLPGGETLLDDFKTKLGGQLQLLKYNNFSASVKIQGIFRRYQSEFVTLSNFGSEFSGTFGYYAPRWYAALDFGFDKSIITHIRHSALMEEYYQDVRSGWYIPTGGNFSYGIQAGYSFNSMDVYIKGGKTISQDFKTKPAIPLYLQLGINRRFF